ncbi:MAG: peptidase M28 family protein, partial [Bacteroidia bacterium]|nr:peptidase M28 family protein [Bacteroidia bacterium]
MKKLDFVRFTLVALCSLTVIPSQSQQLDESDVIRKFFDEALTSYEAFHNLEWLCKNTAGRICGTPEAAEAIEFTRQVMSKMKLDSVWLQPIMVKSWDRGEKEEARIVSEKFGTISVPSCALGWSVGTGSPGLSAGIVEVKSLDELKSRSRKDIEGRIVFFNQPMKQTNTATFSSYGGAVWQRANGPVEAGKLGAVGCVVRSMSIEIDDFPHTGITRYDDDVKPI